MATMEALIHQTKRMLHEVHEGLTELEKATETLRAEQIDHGVQSHLNTIVSNCERLDTLVWKERPNNREKAKLQVDQLKYDCKHLQQALNSVRRTRSQKEAERQREELLMSTTFKPNSSAETSIMIDHALQHNNSLSNAHRGIDDMIGSGSSILESLRGQRSTLKGAHKKMLDIMNTLGLSNTVMRLIERRTYQDSFILYGGMIFTCIVMFLTVKYFLY